MISADGVDQLDDELGQVSSPARPCRRRRTRAAPWSNFGSVLSRWYRPMTCRTFRCWRLYSWMRLTCTSNIADGIHDRRPCAAAIKSASARLVGALDLPPLLRGTPRRRPAARARAAGPDRVIQPSPIRCGDADAQSRGLDSTTQRRGVTPLVLLQNFSGHSSAKSLSTLALEQLRVQRGDAVDGVAADAGEVRHAHVLLAGLVDQRQPADALFVAGERHAHLVEEARVDLVDDLQVPRQQSLEHAQRPASPAPRAAACGWCSAKVWRVMLQARSQSSCRSSTSSRISSATAIDGCVSLS